MEIIFIIQDVKTKEYFWDYRADIGFSDDMDSAKSFESRNEVLFVLQSDDEFLKEIFSGRTLEIKEYIKVD